MISLKKNPQAWESAWVDVQTLDQTAARIAVQTVIEPVSKVRTEDREIAREAAWRAAEKVVQSTALIAAVRGVIYALVVWDDCAYLLDRPSKQVHLLATNGNHAAVLLLLATIVFRKTMPSPRPTKLNTATKIRRALNKGKSPSEIAKSTGASLGYVYAIKAKMTQPAPAPTPEPKPADIKIEVPLIPFAPIPQQGIAGLKEEPQPQPVAAHAANEIVEEAVIEKPDNSKYVWAVAGVLLLTALFLYYFGHRG